MKIQLMDIKRQHETYASEYENAVIETLRSGNYIGGEEVEKFENAFAKYEGAKYGIACGNGTDALVLALRAANIGYGDEVITVAWTFFATAESIASVGATPVFVDVDSKTYCIDTTKIRDKITKKTKAILAVHFYGNSCDMDSLKTICKENNLILIMDCAQSTGTEYKGSRKNTLGDLSCFSFFPTKNLGADGDGGIVLTDNSFYASTCKALRAHGSGKNGLETLKRLFKEEGKEVPKEIPYGESKYYNYLIGYNSRLDSIQAAILNKKLNHIDEFIANRRQNAVYYNNALKNTSLCLPFENPDGKHSYYIYAIKHANAERIKRALEENGIACGTYYPVPLHLQGAFSSLKYKVGDLPITEELSKTTFAIPVFPELTDDEKEYIVNVLKKIVD